MRTHNIPSCQKEKIEKYSLLCLLTWCCQKHSLARTTLSRTYFNGFKDVRAVEVLLSVRNTTILTKKITEKSLCSAKTQYNPPKQRKKQRHHNKYTRRVNESQKANDRANLKKP